jgi:Ni/Co efflux regulator RcnB
MRRLIVTLLTATMMLPTGAVAQERGERRPRAEGDAAAGQVRQRPWRDQMQPAAGAPDDARRRFERAADRGSDQPRSDPRPDARQDDSRRNDAPRYDGRRGEDRRNDGAGNDGRWNAAPRPDRNGPDRNGPTPTGADWSRGGVGTGARYGIRDDDRRGRNDQRDDRRWNDRQDDARRNDDRRRWDDLRRRDGARDDRTRWDDGNRWDDRRAGNTWYSNRDDGNRGGWNRGWRGESRYDWARYRSVNRNAYRLPRYYAPSGWGGGYRRFGIGTRLSSGLWGQNYWIADPFVYRLPEAYGPYRWVRYYGDALLIDLRTGLVVDSVFDIFW